MTELSAAARELLTAHYQGQTVGAARSLVEHQRKIESRAELASDLGLTETEQEADYQAALARAEAEANPTR
ncbi:hypothetical protein M2390_002938 [Mycetocola sp. BIGb0189]|uniref:hypothetical protein n=1 Tax=Mycetocola sp. BIGb0189 TaxID=2940604 RepID=UPI00216A9408|nr:hypothetical protein [Mycetocola sp. BIGb0189]MCS4277729.1 hypothetical protein [Mycetocola sp. BIGb0189]